MLVIGWIFSGGLRKRMKGNGATVVGGDDFDQRLLDLVSLRFKTKHGIDLRESPMTRGRLLRAVEDAKKTLSFEGVAKIEEEFIAEGKGVPLHLREEIDRTDYEDLIEPLLARTLRASTVR